MSFLHVDLLLAVCVFYIHLTGDFNCFLQNMYTINVCKKYLYVTLYVLKIF